MTASSPDTDFGAFVRRAAGRGELVVQPRMGMSDPARMREGLVAVHAAAGCTVGTITLDSYTRVDDLESAQLAVLDGMPLNGYPIATHSPDVTRWVVEGLDFPVQIRHGSAVPRNIFRALLDAGFTATEGGPVSYCLPYGRTPLADSVRNWAAATELLADGRGPGREPHIETFGGCMLGQLCPPSQLVAISVLEALFFRQHGIRDVSLSYAQQTDLDQDVEALAALRRLAGTFLPDVGWHVVIYAYMGVYPETPEGAYALLGRAAQLAATGGAERLIVKTEAESVRIPTIAENVTALELAARTAASFARVAAPADSPTYAEAVAIVGAVLDLSPDIGTALLRAFAKGYLDIPFCLHPDNAGRTRSYIDDGGRLRWAAIGSLPIGGLVDAGGMRRMRAAELLTSLSYVRSVYDAPGLPGGGVAVES
jgi:methylaspartate mutase epsilon subunit